MLAILCSPVVVFLGGAGYLLWRDFGSVDNAVQGAILVCSGAVAFCAGSKEQRVRFIGFCFALAGQPFWLWTAWVHQQWAIVVLAFWYVACHARGVFNNRPWVTYLRDGSGQIVQTEIRRW